MNLMTLTFTFKTSRNLPNEGDVIETTNDLENLDLKFKLRNVVQNLLDEHDLADRVTLTVED